MLLLFQYEIKEVGECNNSGQYAYRSRLTFWQMCNSKQFQLFWLPVQAEQNLNSSPISSNEPMIPMAIKILINSQPLL